MLDDIITNTYRKLILEAEQFDSAESLLDAIEQFKNNISKLKWQFEKQSDVDSFEDFVKEKIGNSDLINVLKNVNNSLHSEDVNDLIIFRNVLKLSGSEDGRYQKYLNKLDAKIKSVLIGIKIENATYLQVLSYCFKYYNTLNDQKLLEQAWNMVSNLANGTMGEFSWPQNDFQKKLFRMVPPKGLLTENDTNIGNGEIYLIMKYGLTSASGASHMDLQTAKGENILYYEVKNITPEAKTPSRAYVHCVAANEKNGKCIGLGLSKPESSFVLILNNSNNTITKIPCADIQKLMMSYYLVDFSQQNWNYLHRKTSGTTKLRKYWVHESLLGDQPEEAVKRIEKEDMTRDPILEGIKNSRGTSNVLIWADRSHGGVSAYGLMKALGYVKE